MVSQGTADPRRRQARRDLLRQYVRLQHELSEADPSSSAYQATIHAFRQMGYILITSGFEDDLDRLLRIRVVSGGRAQPTPRSDRTVPDGLQILEQRSIS